MKPSPRKSRFIIYHTARNFLAAKFKPAKLAKCLKLSLIHIEMCIRDRDKYIICEWNGTLFDDVKISVDTMNIMLEKTGDVYKRQGY